jgi:uncharacterized SAM-dependent methyltransferase
MILRRSSTNVHICLTETGMDVHSELVINQKLSRVEMHLVSRKDQIVNAAGNTFAFRRGERLHTENSHKFSVAMFTALAAEAGWSADKVWISDAPQVALFRLESALSENL